MGPNLSTIVTRNSRKNDRVADSLTDATLPADSEKSKPARTRLLMLPIVQSGASVRWSVGARRCRQRAVRIQVLTRR